MTAPATLAAAADVGSAFATTAFSGPLLLALLVSLVAGAVSFASPCVLPLVPGYLGFLSGLTAQTVQPARAVAGRRPAPPAPGRGRLTLGVALFVLGFALVFVALGALAGSLGGALLRWQDPITRALGVVVIVMGVAFLGGVPFLQREVRVHRRPPATLWGAPVLGVTFGLGWTPCIGPTLAAVMALSLDGGSPARGAVLSAAYALGLGLPFVLLALGLQRSSRLLDIVRRRRRAISVVGGTMLVLIGIALVTGLWGRWAQSLQGLILIFQPVV
ncbi:cytochrome C biogenesis protein CcdA [Cellulomonas hominis]|uniref:Cytochrome C biogenesis protein CcdA n=1 Tax=Cellulomonas hominis TaxID=156981 RepID=A0A511FCK0_9CELL|nr:cytochrome c biogenesis protein CcdA [Cellulomonas hominis]MBB5472880.1 cytochrome c-type biogenesis protein [Cellulomonas hominis]GEL46975.1 cytochrome C biogenesis protein CcdA [Cellulomonas hominis]